MNNRFIQRFIGIKQVHVLAHHLQFHCVSGIELILDDLPPVREICLIRFKTQFLNHNIVKTLLVKHVGNSVNRIGIEQGNDRFGFHVGKQRNLVPGTLRDLMIRSNNQYVRLKTNRTEFLHGVLGGFCLGFTGCCDVGHQCQMHQQRLPGTHFKPELAGGFKEWLRFYITDGATDLYDSDICAFRGLDDSRLDLIGNVRNHLDRCAKVVTTTFLGDDVSVDTSGGKIVIAVQTAAGPHEAFVMTEIKVSFGSIGGDVNLTMLQGTHRARIHIDIGIELHHGDFEATGLEDGAKRGGSNALPKRGNNTTGYKYKTRHLTPILRQATSLL
jgi:hypothetical protein